MLSPESASPHPADAPGDDTRAAALPAGAADAESFALRDGIARHLPGALQPASRLLAGVRAIARFGHAGAGELCFCDRPPAPGLMRADDRSIVLCGADVRAGLAAAMPQASLVAVDDPRAAFIDLVRALQEAGALDVTSAVPAGRGVAASARVGANSVVHADARLDDGVVLGANCVVHGGVWLQAGVQVGDGVVLGGAGINAYRARDGRVLGFPHLAGVIVGEGASVGANAVLVRGVLTSTRIGRGSVIGNLCNIGHGVVIGESAWLSSACSVGGHTRLGRGATLGIGAILRDNLDVGEHAQVGMGAVVVRDVRPGSSVFGNPARPVPGIAAGPQR